VRRNGEPDSPIDALSGFERGRAPGLLRLFDIEEELSALFGEAAKRVSPEFRRKHPNFPWKKTSGMRDRLIHGYFDVNLDIVWQTVTEDLPVLIDKLENLTA